MLNLSVDRYKIRSDRVPVGSMTPKDIDPEYSFLSKYDSLVFEQRILITMIAKLYNYAAENFDRLFEGGDTPEGKRKYFEEHLMERYLNDLTVFLHYWPQAFEYNTLKMLSEIVQAIESIHESTYGITSISYKIAKLDLKIKETLQNYPDQDNLEEFYEDQQENGFKLTDIQIIEEDIVEV